MNLNAFDKTLALLNKNTHFSNTRKPDLIKAFQLVKLLLKMLQFLCAQNVTNENETDAASAACFQNIKYQVEDNVWSLKIRSGIVY